MKTLQIFFGGGLQHRAAHVLESDFDSQAVS